LVAAGYNAGPHRVRNWLSNFGTLDMDEFIEHIPYLETRNYVKKVMSNCQVYGQLYGNKRELFPYLAESVPGKYSTDNVAKENWDDI
jgi:soluble lytic murein transglycosylase